MKHILELIFIRDIWRKLIAFAITMVLFLNLYDRTEREISGVRVKVDLAPEVYLDQNELPTVRLTVKGTKDQVEKLTPGQLAGHVRLTNSAEALRAGWTRLALKTDDFAHPMTVSVVSVEPQILERIRVQRRISRTIKIVPRYSGTPGKGKVVTAVRFTPDSVTVSGPERNVNGLTGILTQEEIKVSGESGDFNLRQVPLQNPAPGKISFSVDAVDAAVEIREPTEFPRRFERVPLRLLIAPEQNGRVTAEVREAALTVTGAQDEIDRLKAEDFTVCVAAGRLSAPGEYLLSPTVLPEKLGNTVRVVRIEPEKIKVTLAPQPAPQKK